MWWYDVQVSHTFNLKMGTMSISLSQSISCNLSLNDKSLNKEFNVSMQLQWIMRSIILNWLEWLLEEEVIWKQVVKIG